MPSWIKHLANILSMSLVNVTENAHCEDESKIRFPQPIRSRNFVFQRQQLFSQSPIRSVAWRQRQTHDGHVLSQHCESDFIHLVYQRWYDQIISWRLYSKRPHVNWIQTHPPRPLLPSPQPPAPLILFLLSWKAMHPSTRRKALHRANPGWRSSLDILSGPRPSSSSWPAALHPSEQEKGPERAAASSTK